MFYPIGVLAGLNDRDAWTLEKFLADFSVVDYRKFECIGSEKQLGILMICITLKLKLFTPKNG